MDFPSLFACHENVFPERKRILQAYGTNIIYTDPAKGSDGAIQVASQLAQRHAEGRITHFVAMVGTCQPDRRRQASAVGDGPRSYDASPADQNQEIVTVLCDYREKYLSEKFWNEE